MMTTRPTMKMIPTVLARNLSMMNLSIAGM